MLIQNYQAKNILVLHNEYASHHATPHCTAKHHTKRISFQLSWCIQNSLKEDGFLWFHREVLIFFLLLKVIQDFVYLMKSLEILGSFGDPSYKKKLKNDNFFSTFVTRSHGIIIFCCWIESKKNMRNCDFLGGYKSIQTQISLNWYYNLK